MPTATEQPSAPATPDSSPDWNTVVDDVQCPLCEYNLRGLTQPRCPECGYQFSWAELFDTTRRLHPYLFEHHPERNFWSFWRTLLGGLRPATFWRSLHPSQPSRTRRILLYAILCQLPLLLLVIADAALDVIVEIQRQRAQQLLWLGRGFTTTMNPITPAVVEGILRWQFAADSLLQVGVACLLWPWLSLAGLLLFRWSMRRAKVRRVHVVRCVVYAADLLVCFSPLYAVVAAEHFLNHFGPLMRGSSQPLPLVFAAALVLLFSYRLIHAYRHYLRFDRVEATVLASQIMAGLAAWKLLLVLQGY